VYDPVIPLVYDKKLAISGVKHQDLMSLCAAGLIPKIYHPFYESLGFVEEDPEEMEEDPGEN
jgi:hypothetical protein